MYIIDTKRKIYYNTKLNKILDLTELKYVKNDALIEFYKNEISKHVILNEKIKLIEESNAIYTGYGYLIDEHGNWFSDAFSKVGDFLKGMVPDTLEDWIHLGVDVISGLFDAFGAVSFGGTNVISLIIDVLHGLYYIGAAYGVGGIDRTSKKEEYLLMGAITMGFAFVPGIGNAANIALKGALKSSAKAGSKTFIKKVLGNNLLVKGLKKVFKFFFSKGPKAVLKKFKTIIEYLSGFKLIRWLFDKLGLKKLFGFFFKNADKVLDDMAGSKIFKQIAKEIDEPIASAATKTAGKLSVSTAKEHLQIAAGQALKKMGTLGAKEGPIAKKAIKELQEELAKATAKNGGKSIGPAGVKKIVGDVTSKYSGQVGSKAFSTAMKELGENTQKVLAGKGGLSTIIGGMKGTMKKAVREPIYNEVNKKLAKKIAAAEAKGLSKVEVTAIQKASREAIEQTYITLSKKTWKGGVKKVTQKELDDIAAKIIAKSGSRVTSTAGKELLEDAIKTSVKTAAKHEITRHISGAAFKKFFVKQLAAANLIYSDNARNSVNWLLGILGIRQMPDEVNDAFIEALKAVSELVPHTTRSQIENDELNEEGIRILQTFLNKFPEYSGQTEFGDIEENGILNARTIIGEEYFISNMNKFLDDGTIYGYKIDYDEFNKKITIANEKMAKIGDELQKKEQESATTTELDIDKIDVDQELSAASEAIIYNFNKFVKDVL